MQTTTRNTGNEVIPASLISEPHTVKHKACLAIEALSPGDWQGVNT